MVDAACDDCGWFCPWRCEREAAAAWLTWKWNDINSIFVSKLVVSNTCRIYKVLGFPGSDAWEGF
jgi:hypothetical protein